MSSLHSNTSLWSRILIRVDCSDQHWSDNATSASPLVESLEHATLIRVYCSLVYCIYFLKSLQYNYWLPSLEHFCIMFIHHIMRLPSINDSSYCRVRLARTSRGHRRKKIELSEIRADRVEYTGITLCGESIQRQAKQSFILSELKLGGLYCMCLTHEISFQYHRILFLFDIIH